MRKVSGQFFDGVASKPITVTLTLSDSGLITVTNSEFERRLNYKDIKISQRISNIPRSLYLKDGSKVEIQDNEAFDDYLNILGKDRHWNWLHQFEKRKVGIIGAVIGTFALLYLAAQYGIPNLAQYTAQAIPRSVEEEVSEHALSLLDEALFRPTTLSQQRQEELKSKFRSLSANSEMASILRFEFRDSESVGPNAFALPSGIIVFTDQLVKLVSHDNELLAILSHEIGHVKFRHSLRNLLQSSTTALLIATVTGDMASIAGLAVTLPTILMESKYSREFESEADEYAYQYLQKEGIKHHYFADALMRMTTENERQAEKSFNYLSTHPATSERIARFLK